MSFKFDFQIDEDGENVEGVQELPQSSSSSSTSPCHHVTLEELLDTLPDTISYTPFFHPTLKQPLLRRDLFDARFQLISQDAQDTSMKGKGKADDYVDAKTDLIPGLYEGGLKTWEGGVDLLEVLAEATAIPDGKRVLEVGCGTALPSCFLLHSLLSRSRGSGTIHLQDYNLLVLQLVTLPNLLLTVIPFLPATAFGYHDDEESGMTWGGVDQPGHLQITRQIKGAFKTILEESGIKLEFTYCHWAGLAKEIKQEYDVVLTAETIYAEESVDDLIKLLQAAVGVTTEQAEPASSGNKEDWATGIAQGERIVLVAAKVLYFGVGGGLAAFLHKVESDKGWWTNVKEWTRGVGRKVVRIGWA